MDRLYGKETLLIKNAIYTFIYKQNPPNSKSLPIFKYDGITYRKILEMLSNNLICNLTTQTTACLKHWNK